MARTAPSLSDRDRILFVDDEKAICGAFVRTLEPTGITIDTATSAAHAMQRFARYRYPVVVVDLGLRDQDGAELIRRLSAADPRTTFIVVTGRADPNLPSDAMFRDRVVSVIPKPWNKEELLDAVELAQSRSEYLDQETPKDGPTEARRVLLVEDDPGDVELLRRYLGRAGLEVEIDQVPRLSDALDRLGTHAYDVVLADLGLPDACGLDSVFRIQNTAPDVPLIILSGLEDDTMAVKAVQAGAQDFLAKDRLDATLLARSIRYAAERKRSELETMQLAFSDSMTGLANRSAFRCRLDNAMARAKRSREPFAVLFIDLDDFKPINDQHGHAVGDHVLIEVGRRLRAAVREYDVVARFGGDEFAIILERLSYPDEAQTVAERIRDTVSQPICLSAAELRVTASIGIALYPDAGQTAGDLLKAADQAMYAVKRRRGGPTSGGSAILTAVDENLAAALRRHDFVVHYRPQYDVAARRFASAEAMIRRNVTGSSDLSGPTSMSLERVAEVRKVGYWVAQTACQQLMRWQHDGVPIERVAVNVSGRQLEDPKLHQSIQEAVEASELQPDQLELQVAESTVMKDLERFAHLFGRLRDWGVRVAIENFGARSSSLSYLHRLPIDTLKIDRSFTQQLLASEECRIVTTSIIGLGRRLGKVVIADGVETDAQRVVLESEGCDVLQGCLFGRPRPAEDFAAAEGAGRRRLPRRPLARSSAVAASPHRSSLDDPSVGDSSRM